MNDDWEKRFESYFDGLFCEKCEKDEAHEIASCEAHNRVNHYWRRKKIKDFLSKEIERVREDRNKEIGNALRRIVAAHPDNEMIVINDILNFAEHLHPNTPKGNEIVCD